MSKIISIRLPDETEKKLSEISKETERTKSFHIQKAIENYIEQFADYRIALDRLNDSNDEIISAEEMRKHFDVQVKFKKSVYKDLSKFPPDKAKIILDKTDILLADKPAMFPALKGKFKGMRRMRVGNYRVIYEIIEDVVLVLRIHHRKDVYK